MAVDKHKRDNSSGGDGGSDRFPAGMRVLAVDDDRTCLNILESLLRQCEYQVTSTTQAVRALEMLRENKNRFDLVISDVNMPDMDGFKLLELVGLEMDLPVIMLSVDSDTKLVMKGITHGAVDYLVKPVRLEELKNIWQHVVRKKKFEPRGKNKAANQEIVRGTLLEAEQGIMGTNGGDLSGKVNKKRKDQSEDEEEDDEGDQDDRENEDSTSQKKPRVVWAAELHKKFVAAVHQLGLDKAVPKKILELMNIEGLTRENVASHLQKYRLYLKKTAPDQDNMAFGLGSKDQSFMLGDYRSLNRPVRLSSSAISSMPYQPSGILGRLNSPSALSLSGIAGSSMIQQGNPQNSIPSAYSLYKSQPSLLQGTPTSSPAQISGFISRVSNPTSFSGLSTFGSSSNSVSTAIRNNTLLQANQNQPSLAVVPLNQEPFNVDVRVSSSFTARSNNNWQGSVPLSKFASSSLPMIEASSHEPLSSNNLRAANNLSWTSIGDLPSSMVNTASVDQSSGYNQVLNQSFSGVVPAGVGLRDAPLFAEQTDSEKSLFVPQLRSNEDSLFDQVKSQNGFIQSDYDPLDDMLNPMIKSEQDNQIYMDEEFWM